MTKRYAVLQKRLEELETELQQVVSLPPERIEFRYNQLYALDVDKKLVFLRNLLAAETSSSSPEKPQHHHHHLEHIAKRLSNVETAFREWDRFGVIASTNVVDPERVETASACSCTESCLNGDGEQSSVDSGSSSGGAFEKPEAKLLEDFPEGKVVKEEEKMTEKSVVVVDGGGNYNNGKCFCGGLVSGVVIGMGFMSFVMLRFCTMCLFPYNMEHCLCLTPT